MNKRGLALYIHVPFCIRKCLYCDFISSAASEETIDKYFAALNNEAASYTDRMDDYAVSSIYIGGGTPSSVDCHYIADILDRISRVFSIEDDAEISIEVNPGTADKEKFYMYRRAGINRMSIGLQSASDEELRRLGRIHTYSDFLNTYSLARKAGFGNINIDVMTSIPGQDLDSASDTLKKAVSLQPEHISAYSLIVEPGTPFGKTGAENLDLPDEDTDMSIYSFTREYLKSEGYVRYEISNYATAGRECRHNTVYWRRGDYLGLGLGAASMIGTHRFSNTGDMSGYLDSPGRIRQEDRILTKEQCMEEFMFLGLRMINGVSRDEFKNEFGYTIEDIYGDIVKAHELDGTLILSGDRCRLTERGLDVSNIVMADFVF